MEGNKKDYKEMMLQSNFDLLDVHDNLEGLSILLTRFYEDSILNRYNTPTDPKEMNDLIGDIFPLIISTLDSNIKMIDSIHNEFDYESIHLEEEKGA